MCIRDRYFRTALFIGDSLSQGFALYAPTRDVATVCAYKSLSLIHILSGQGVRTLAEADGQAEQDDEAQEEADGAEQDVRRADKKENASRAGTEHSGGRTVTTADRTQAQAARTAD